jgi:anti-anti-sigma factor
VTAGRKFSVEVRRKEATAVVVPVGELDLATVDLVEQPLQELADAGVRRIVLDLRRLTFIDSTGLRLVLRWYARAGENEIAFELVQGSSAIEHVFEVAGLLDRLPFVGPIETDETPVGDSS